jgi:hypothetical protein
MPAYDGVRLHDDQRRAPVPPGMGEQHPKQSISMAEWRPQDRAPEYHQLLAERQFSSATVRCPQQISASDRSTTTSAASMSYPAAQPTTEPTGLVAI